MPFDEPDLDFTVIEPEKKPEYLQYGLHGKGRTYITHYSGIKEQYKKLAVGWLTSLLIGLAFLGAHQAAYFNINKLYLIALITFFGWIGIKFIRYLDLNIYHRQMAEIYVSMLELEKKYPTLSRSTIKMSSLLHRKIFDPIIFDSIYYASLGIVIAAIGTVTLYLKLSLENTHLGVYAVFGLMAFFFIWELVTLFTALKFGGSRIEQKRNGSNSHESKDK